MTFISPHLTSTYPRGMSRMYLWRPVHLTSQAPIFRLLNRPCG
jgi:hypothetical protein